MITRIYNENGTLLKIEGNFTNNKNYLKGLIKENASKKILDKYPEFKQMNAIMGIYGEEYKTNMINEIQSIRAKISELELKIDEAKSQKELDGLDYSV